MLIFDYCNFDITGIISLIDKRKNIDNINIDVNQLFDIYNVDIDNIKLIILGFHPISKSGFVAKGELDNNSPLFTLKECIVDNTIPHNAIDFDITYKSIMQEGVLFLDFPLCLDIKNYNYYIKIWKPFIIKFLREFSSRNNGIIYLLLGNMVSDLDKYIYNGFILKDNHPNYYCSNNIRMGSEVINKINNLTIKNYGKKIKWYREI